MKQHRGLRRQELEKRGPGNHHAHGRLQGLSICCPFSVLLEERQLPQHITGTGDHVDHLAASGFDPPDLDLAALDDEKVRSGITLAEEERALVEAARADSRPQTIQVGLREALEEWRSGEDFKRVHQIRQSCPHGPQVRSSGCGIVPYHPAISVTEVPPGILTFLFADIRGWTAFTQQNGDEAAARLAAKFAEVTREGVESRGGRVIELRGDEALAVFTSARAAVRAAVDLQAVYMDETTIEPQLPLTAGIGMDAGEAVPVEGGYRGAALNLGARLNKRASVGEVLVSEGLVHLIGVVDGIRLEEQGEAEVKGISRPVKIFTAVADRPEPELKVVAPQDIPSHLRVVAPMIGREVELRRLRWTWRTCRRRPGAVRGVLGPTGIGKTRLLAELAATVARSGGTVTYTSFAATHDGVNGWPGAPGSPGLVILDDLDAATLDELATVEKALATDAGAPALLCLALDDERASPQITAAVRRLAAQPESILRLPPLDLQQMLRLAALYLGDAVDSIPREVLTSTGGVPRRVHEEVGRWAYEEASRRLGKLASQAAAGRDDLRTVEADLAGTVIDLQLVRDQSRLFGLTPGRARTETARSPYLGLASFEADDAEFYFGRERLVAESVAKLAGSPFLGVVGPSGSGKSSAVRAGLIPALALGALPGSEAWTVVLFRPGDHPLRALDRALWAGLPGSVAGRLGDTDVPLAELPGALGPDGRLVVVIDQFEETFTACDDGEERTRFVAALVDAAAQSGGSVAVVPVIRADYYGRCAEHPGLAELLASNHVLVGPMNAEEYRRVIVQPASRAGVEVETELADDLVAEVIGEPGALPLLSTTLLELWQGLDGRTMRRQAYLASGGLHGAVARLADRVYGGLDGTQRAVARRIFLRLAGPGEGDMAVRRRVPLSEFDAERDEAMAQVIDVLTSGRLLTVSDGAVEVAHEALLREWPRLQEWLEEDREGRRLHAHLTATAQEWEHRSKDAAELYRGARLAAAMDWTTDHNLELNDLERDFVRTSRAATQRDLAQHKRQNRQLRGLLGGVAALLVIAVLAGSVALVQRQSAETAARQALAGQLGAEALTTQRTDQAMLLARQALLLDRSIQTESTLLATLLRSPAVIGTFTTPITVRPLSPALSPDGRTLAVFDNNSEILFFDTRTYKQSHAPLSHIAGGFGPGALGFAGPYFFTPYAPPGSPPGIAVFDATSLRLIRTLPFSAGFMNNLTGTFNPLVASVSGQHVFFCWTLANQDDTDGPAYVDGYDVSNGSLKEVAVGSKGMNGAGMVREDRLMVVTDTAAVTLDGITLQPVGSIPVSLSPGPVAVSPAGDRLAATGLAPAPSSHTFSLIDLKTGRTTPAGGSHAAEISGLSFTTDGRLVVTISNDHNAIVWDAGTGGVVETLAAHSSGIKGLAISADSRTLYTSSADGAIFGWDLSGAHQFGRRFDVSTSGPLDGPPAPTPLALSPDGTRFATRTAPGEIGIFSMRSLDPEQSLSLPPGTDALSVAWSRNNLLAVGGTSAIQLWGVEGTPALLEPLAGVPGRGRAVAFSADGRAVAAVTIVPPRVTDPSHIPDGWLAVWDLPSGNLRFSQQLGAGGLSVAVNAHARLVAAGVDDARVLLVDLDSGTVRQTIRPAGGSTTAVEFRPDGSLVTGSWAGIVQRWDPHSARELDHAILTEGGPVSMLSVAPDLATFATSAGDAKIWGAATRQQFGATLPTGGGGWVGLAYTPDGSNLLVMSKDGSGTIWPTSVSAWMDHACAVAQRNFTHEEWSRFVPGYPYQRTCPTYPPGP